MSDDGLVVKPQVKTRQKKPALRNDPVVGAAGAGSMIEENPLPIMPSSTVTQEDFDAATPSQATSTGNARADEILSFARSMIGTPYKWGQSGPLGVDCSGFTQYVFKRFGINLPRISYQQGTAGRAVNGGEWQPGDLLFWDNSSRNNGADHVAIYIGNGQMISAPKPGDSVKIQAVYGKPWARRYL